MPETKKCSPNCQKFRCGKSALQYRGKTVWCKWGDEPCDPTNCSYAICITRRLLSNGTCGETVKRKTTEKDVDENSMQTIRVRGKTYRKIGEKEIF